MLVYVAALPGFASKHQLLLSSGRGQSRLQVRGRMRGSGCLKEPGRSSCAITGPALPIYMVILGNQLRGRGGDINPERRVL